MLWLNRLIFPHNMRQRKYENELGTEVKLLHTKCDFKQIHFLSIHRVQTGESVADVDESSAILWASDAVAAESRVRWRHPLLLENPEESGERFGYILPPIDASYFSTVLRAYCIEVHSLLLKMRGNSNKSPCASGNRFNQWRQKQWYTGNKLFADRINFSDNFNIAATRIKYIFICKLILTSMKHLKNSKVSAKTPLQRQRTYINMHIPAKSTFRQFNIFFVVKIFYFQKYFLSHFALDFFFPTAA